MLLIEAWELGKLLECFGYVCAQCYTVLVYADKMDKRDTQARWIYTAAQNDLQVHIVPSGPVFPTQRISHRTKRTAQKFPDSLLSE